MTALSAAVCWARGEQEPLPQGGPAESSVCDIHGALLRSSGQEF